jgi:ATPase family associated with various cellular activities (AAA)
VWLRWVRLAARLRVEQTRAGWQTRGATGVHGTIDAILREPPVRDPRDDAARNDPDVLVRAEAEVGADSTWRRLTEAFGLDREERQLLALLAATHVEERIGRVLGYLDDDPQPHSVTAASAARLWGWPLGTMPGPGSALHRWQIASPLVAEPWQPGTPWVLDPDISAYLCERPEWASFWPGLAHIRATTAGPACLHGPLLDELASAATTLSAKAGRPVELELIGRPGSGRRTLLAQLCRRLGRDALVVTSGDAGVRALRTARLLGAIPVWIDCTTIADPRPGALTLSAHERTAQSADDAAIRLTFEIPELIHAQRLSLWKRFAKSSAKPPHPVTAWTLTPAEIAAAAAARPGGHRAVTAVTRRRLGTVSSTLMTEVRCPYGWEDLVVAEPVLDQLEELESQVRLAGEVLDDWGFRRLTPESRGTTALFAGPSGTGKTMAASVIARSLGLDLYRVDLAEVVNKYIGETEKRLAQVFDECERCNVMVLFDEADALFGQRTRVRDAHDRFANIEIDYLLQRMESFDGVAILATNRKGDLDPAFVRRLRVIVDFTAPTATERKRLWELALPPTASDGRRITRELDVEWLADSLTMTGAEIKSAALGAAFMARAGDVLVDTEHVLTAARRELAKKGTVLRDERPLAGAHSVNGNGGRR